MYAQKLAVQAVYSLRNVTRLPVGWGRPHTVRREMVPAMDEKSLHTAVVRPIAVIFTSYYLNIV